MTSFYYQGNIGMTMMMQQNTVAAQVKVVSPVPMNVTENMLYQGNKLDQRSFNFYRFNHIIIVFQCQSFKLKLSIFNNSQFYLFQNVGNKSQAQLSNTQLYFRVDSEDSFSDPEIFISKCLGIANVTDGTNLKQVMDGRSAAVFQFSIPEISYDAETLSQSNPLDIMFSITNDLSLTEEKHLDVVTENGKAMKFTSDDYGWCTSCQVYFIVSARVPGVYQISTKTSARKEMIPEQQSVARVVNQFERECFTQTTTNDVIFTIIQNQGDLDLSLVLRNPLNTSQEINLLNSEVYTQRGLISKASDRLKLGFQTGLIYLCANPYTDSMFQIFASQQFQLQRFDAQDDTLYSLTLDAQDYVYFRYNSAQLTTTRQIQVQVSNFVTNNSTTVPRMYYRVCVSPNPEECFLSDSMARGFWDGDVILTEIFNTTNQTNTKVGLINHNPSVFSYLLNL